ncbi:MAG: TAXI family TRAP transporter solute-binding subunit [Thermodesulfobacteriota bacterium]
MKKKWMIDLLVLIVLSSIVIWMMPEGANSAQSSEPSKKKVTYTIVIGTSSVGSSGYTQGVGIANIISKKTPAISVTARPVGGSDANVRAVRDGKVEVAIVNAVSAVQGLLGMGAYSKEGRAPLRLLLQGFLTPRFIVTRKASRIEKLEDLQGKTIVGKRPAMADIEAATLAYLEIAGISKEKIKIVETVETGETIEALKIGSVDGALLPTTFLSPGFQELSRTTDVTVPSLTQDQAKKMIEKLGPAFRPMKVPPGTFKGQEKEILTIATPMILMARDDLSQDVVYMVVKTLLDNEKDVKALHSEAQYWTLENTLESPPLPFHGGVEKLLKEKGAWTPNLDGWQKKALAESK